MGFFSDLFGGKTSSSTTQTSTVTMPDWLQTPAQNLIQQATQFTSRPYTPYGGQTVAGWNPWQTQGYGMQADLAKIGGPTYGMAAQGLQDTIAGNGFRPAATNPYAGANNPYLREQIDAAQGDVIRNYNNIAKPQMDAAMVRSGSFGNSGLQQMQQMQQSDLTRNLGRISSDMRMADYGLQAGLGESAANRQQNAFEAERGRQFGAYGMAPGFDAARFMDAQMLQNAGGAQQGQQQRELDDQYRRFLEQQNFPLMQMLTMQGFLNPMLNTFRGQTTTGTQENTDRSKGWGAITNFAGALGSLFSDERLKEDITKVGKTDGGLNVYTYKYKGDPTTHMGVMAQEVKKKKPSAVGSAGGLLTVDYSKVK